MFYISPPLAERGAARLAHRSGGPGVGGSNPLAPTIETCGGEDGRTDLQAQEVGHAVGPRKDP